MKSTAARLVEHGKPLNVTQVDLSAPADDEVEIEMLFGGVNPIDRYRAAGTVAPDAPLPRTLGAEGVGTFEGKPVAVFGHGVGNSRDGIWATRAVVPRAALVPLPSGIDVRQAAVMGVAGTTAWRTATELAEVTADDRVLVLGASGGVGSIIVSIADRIGARVWGQSSDPDNTDWLTRQGAERIVTGGPDELPGQVEDLHPTVVFDPLGGGFTGAAIQALAPYGRLVVFGSSAGASGTIPVQTLYRSGLRIIGYGGMRDSDEVIAAKLAASLEALATGRLSVVVDQTLPLNRVNDAFNLLAQRKVKGKLVLDLHG
jgi:NADPH2:quinone reductase